MFKKYVLPACILIVINACDAPSSSNNKQTDESAASAIVQSPRIYEAMVLKRSSAAKEISLPAELKPFDAAKIFSKVNGFIKTRNVDIGSKVRKGQVLAVIEAPELKAQLDEARAKVEAARAKYIMSKDTYDRINESSQTSGVISPNELQINRHQMLSDSALYASATYNFNAGRDLNNYLIIKSPFDGVVSARNADVGDIVGPNSPKPMFEIEINRMLRLSVPVPESMTGDKLVSRDIKFDVSAYPGKFFRAQFARRSYQLDIDTRSETWEFDAANPDLVLKPGMYADAVFELARKEGVFLVPKSAVITTLAKNFVILVHNSTVQPVNVTNGVSTGDSIEVFGDIQASDTVLVNGSEEIQNGMRVGFKLEQK